jgi:hypothetical protein
MKEKIKADNYKKVKLLDKKAMSVSNYARKNGIKSPAAVYVKYNRWKFGYKSAKGTHIQGEYPGYEIVNFEDMLFVIPEIAKDLAVNHE